MNIINDYWTHHRICPHSGLHYSINQILRLKMNLLVGKDTLRSFMVRSFLDLSACASWCRACNDFWSWVWVLEIDVETTLERPVLEFNDPWVYRVSNDRWVHCIRWLYKRTSIKRRSTGKFLVLCNGIHSWSCVLNSDHSV